SPHSRRTGSTSPLDPSAAMDDHACDPHSWAPSIRSHSYSLDYLLLAGTRMITLTVLSGPDAGSVFSLDHDAVVIGRGNDCTVVLHDSALGRRHCEIRRRGGQMLLIDLGSVNGTFINNHPERVSTQVLKNRDEISVGKSRLRIEFQEREESLTANAITLGNS